MEIGRNFLALVLAQAARNLFGRRLLPPDPFPCAEKGEVLPKGVGTLQYLFHQMHLCSGSLMV